MVVVAAAGLFIFVSMSGSDSKASKSGKQTASALTEKPPEEGPKEAPTPPEGAKQPSSEDPLAGMVLGPKGKPVGPAKRLPRRPSPQTTRSPTTRAAPPATSGLTPPKGRL